MFDIGLVSTPETVSVPRVYAAKTDVDARTMVLTRPGDQAWTATARFAFDRPDPAHLSLDGIMDGHPNPHDVSIIRQKQAAAPELRLQLDPGVPVQQGERRNVRGPTVHRIVAAPRGK